MRIVEDMLGKFHSYDIASLMLRLGVGIPMLLHGIHKIRHGISGVEKMVVAAGFPEMMTYGVYIGEVIAPIMLILGIYPRFAALMMSITSLAIIYIAHGANLLALNAYGGLKMELPLLFFIGSLALVLMGGEKWAIKR